VGHGVEALSDVVDVFGVETSDGDTSIHSHVDSVFFTEFVDHLGVEASEGEHANLACDVSPIVLVSECGKLLDKGSTHLSHTAGHVSQVLVPHGGQLFVSKDNINDTSTVDGRVGVDWSGNLLYAGKNDILLRLASGNNGDATSTLTIETKVLGERLEEHDVVGMLLEKLERVAIFLEITTGETLIGRVESGEQLFALNNLEDVLPLRVGGVNTGGVVGADVEHDNRVVFGIVKIFLHAFEVETLGGWVVIAVVFTRESGKICDSSVNRPGGVGYKEIDVLVLVPLLKEGVTNSKGSSTRDGLSASDSVLLEGLAVSTVSELEALLDVRVNTLDGCVLVIHVAFEDNLLSTLNAGKNEWLAIIISISTHTEKDLLGVGILLEGVVETENRVSGGTGQSSPVGETSSALTDNLTVCTVDEASKHVEIRRFDLYNYSKN